jgi:hypothetical protein
MLTVLVSCRDASRRAMPLPAYLVYHVPKCAGRTIHRHLTTELQPDVYYRTQKRRGPERFLLARHYTKRMPDPGQIRVVGGHFLGVSVESWLNGRELVRSILLRDPVSHIVSYYNFRMMRYLSQGLHPYSFELAYGATRRNFIAHYILRNFLEIPWALLARCSDEEKYALVNAFLARFWYVADYKYCDDLIAALAPRLQISAHAPARNTCFEWQSRVGWRTLEPDDLPAGAIARIRRENFLDQQLWETWGEARNETSHVRPRALQGRTTTQCSIAREATRFVSQIARRIVRRWGSLDTTVTENWDAAEPRQV